MPTLPVHRNFDVPHRPHVILHRPYIQSMWFSSPAHSQTFTNCSATAQICITHCVLVGKVTEWHVRTKCNAAQIPGKFQDVCGENDVGHSWPIKVVKYQYFFVTSKFILLFSDPFLSLLGNLLLLLLKFWPQKPRNIARPWESGSVCSIDTNHERLQ